MPIIAPPPANPMVDIYQNTLQHLSSRDKKELVVLLTASIQKEERRDMPSFDEWEKRMAKYRRLDPIDDYKKALMEALDEKYA